MRRERLCIPVRRGRQGELPKGSVTLAASESGNTLYMEPQVGGAMVQPIVPADDVWGMRGVADVSGAAWCAWS